MSWWQRFTVIWYGADRARHAEEIEAVNKTAAVGAVLRLHRDAVSAYIARG